MTIRSIGGRIVTEIWQGGAEVPCAVPVLEAEDGALDPPRARAGWGQAWRFGIDTSYFARWVETVERNLRPAPKDYPKRSVTLVLAPRKLGTSYSAIALSNLKELPDASIQSTPHMSP